VSWFFEFPAHYHFRAPRPQLNSALGFHGDIGEDTLELINESDRGAVIVAAALLEDDLDEILKGIIQSHDISAKHIKDMFDLSGPLSSFSSKSLICYGFGFISKEIFDDLTKIRKLRNKFAHSSEKVDFLSADIEAHVATINCCIEASNNSRGRCLKEERNPLLMIILGSKIGRPDQRASLSIQNRSFVLGCNFCA